MNARRDEYVVQNRGTYYWKMNLQKATQQYKPFLNALQRRPFVIFETFDLGIIKTSVYKYYDQCLERLKSQKS